LRNNFHIYYENKLKVKLAYENFVKLSSSKIKTEFEKINPTIKLESNFNNFGEQERSVKNLLNCLRNNYKNLIFLIENLSDESKNDMADFFAHFFFENILIQNPECDELLIFLYMLLEKEINNLNTPSIDSFLESSFVGRFLKSICRRFDIKNYLSLTLRDLIYELENQSENFMEIDLNVINDKLKHDKIDLFKFTKNYDIEEIKSLYEKNKNSVFSYLIKEQFKSNLEDDCLINNFEDKLKLELLEKQNSNNKIKLLKIDNQESDLKTKSPFAGLDKSISPIQINTQSIKNQELEAPTKLKTDKNLINKKNYNFNKESNISIIDLNQNVKISDSFQINNNFMINNNNKDQAEKENNDADVYKYDITEENLIKRYILTKDIELKNYCNKINLIKIFS